MSEIIQQDRKCQFVFKNHKVCNKPCDDNEFCKKHQPKEDSPDTKPQDDATIIESEISFETLSDDAIVNVKGHMDIKKFEHYKYIDQYFEDHYKRCKTLECVGKDSKKSSFDMSTLMMVGGMTLLPLLMKQFGGANFDPKNLSRFNNIDNATNDNLANGTNESKTGNTGENRT